MSFMVNFSGKGSLTEIVLLVSSSLVELSMGDSFGLV